MEKEVIELLQREIAEIEEQLGQKIASWKVMKDEYEAWCRERRGEYGDSVADDELEWERGASVREYHRMYIEPLEDLLADKRRDLKLFRGR